MRGLIAHGTIKGKDAIGVRIGKVVDKYRMSKHLVLDIRDPGFDFHLDEDKVAAEAAQRLPTDDVVCNHKVLSEVERAFRSSQEPGSASIASQRWRYQNDNSRSPDLGLSCALSRPAQSSAHSFINANMQTVDTPIPTKRYTLLGTSPSVAQLRIDIESAARSEAKVLLTGETGVGKEVVAHEIHHQSRRSGAPFISINCAGIPDTLLESEFFGHTRGSFTGAFRDNPGLLRRGHGGTVFLDEVGEMSLRMQALFLRFLETGELQTVGAGAVRTPVDVRIITATNRNLLESVSAREFRADLYYRLNVFHLHIVPLRERTSDIGLLLEHYGGLFGRQGGRAAPVFSDAAIELLARYPWPGNIRELRNLIERVVSRATTQVIEPAHLPKEVLAAVSAANESALENVRLAGPHHARREATLERMMVHRESFWTSAYADFISRDISRDDMRYFIQAGLEHTHGSYRILLGLFNMPASDYKRFLGFLKQHDCHLPFQRFRVLHASRPGGLPLRRADTCVS